MAAHMAAQSRDSGETRNTQNLNWTTVALLPLVVLLLLLVVVVLLLARAGALVRSVELRTVHTRRLHHSSHPSFS